jgi:hypothetical protein
MYAVFGVVEMLPGTTEEGAIKDLKEGLIPGVKQAPGFVKGTWFGDDKHGHGLLIFETEEQAKLGLLKVGDVFMGVRVISSGVYRLHAEA